MEMVQYMQPTQRQLDEFQEDVVLCAPGYLEDVELFEAFNRNSGTTIMTVLHAAAQRVNRVVVDQLFAGREPE